MRKIAKGRVVGLIVAAISIWGAISFGSTATKMNVDYHDSVVARPMETAIDLSIAGETTVPFTQTCSNSHGQTILLDCDLVEGENEKPGDRSIDFLRKLTADIVIHDADGVEIAEVSVEGWRAHRRWDGEIVLAEFHPFSMGEYVATIDVKTGAPSLADSAHTIYASYELCGLEQLPVYIAGGVAFGAGAIGLLSGLCVLPGLLRHGVCRTEAGENEQGRTHADPR